MGKALLKKRGRSKKPSRSVKKKSDHPIDLPPDLLQLVKSLKGLSQQAYSEYSPLVDDIIQNAPRDVRQIEHLLDGILGFCYDDKMLVLYKRLCRHYYSIDPIATREYVYLYREMWDEGKIQ
jgi:hypothetical protein